MKKFGLEKEIEIISKNHGKIFEGNASYGKIKIIPLYHPAVAIYSRTQLPQLKEDFALLKEYNS
jgi:DNA polymerase